MPLLDPLSISIDSPVTGPVLPPKPQRKLLRRIDSTDDFILELDYSSISSFLECNRKGENALVHARQGLGTPTALNWGSLFHKLEEFRLLNGLYPEVLSVQHETIAKWFVDHPVPVDEYRNAGRMIDTLAKYYKLYANDSWHDMVTEVDGEKMVERPFKIELCTIEMHDTVGYHESELVIQSPGLLDPTKDRPSLFIARIHVLLTGKIDLVLSTPAGHFVVDHKTTSRGGREFEEAFGLSLQPRGYCYAAQQLGIPVQGCILNGVICRPLTKTGTGTEFIRQTFFYDTDLLTDYVDSMKAIVEDFVHCLVRGFFPQTGARSFISQCPRCDFQINCRLPRAQRAADLASPSYGDITWSPMDSE